MKLKVVSFNILCVDWKRIPDHLISDRAPRLKKVISPFDPDVIGLQEYRDPWESHIKEQFPEYEMYNAWRSDGWDRESGPILWKRDKFELLDSGHFWFSDTPEVMSGSEWDVAFHCNRICAYVILKEKQTGKTFVAMNTHFGFGDEAQVKSADLIKRYCDSLGDFPVFITGDFNASPQSPAYARMAESFTDANAVTAKDKRRTYHGFSAEGMNDDHLEGQIDYCFVNQKIKPLRRERIDRLVDGKFPSDHFGVYVELDL